VDLKTDAPELISLRERMHAGALLVATLVALIIVAMNNPHQPGTLPACPFRTLTDWLCPGCGSTRMMHHVLHGEFGVAFGYNPVAFCFLPFVAIRGRGLQVATVKSWMPRIALFVFPVWGVVRNFVDSPAAH
jgi:hypothetical protein